MFGNMKNMMGQIQMVTKMMKNENFRALMSHPKVQEVFKDPAVQAAAKGKDPVSMMNHPKMLALMNDPEIRQLFSKLKPEDFQ